MKYPKPYLIYLLILFLAFVNISAPIHPVTAQVDPGFKELFQHNRHVGAIFVPDRASDACVYMEYWYLFSNYVYPGRDNPVATTIKPVDGTFDSLGDFEDQMNREYPGGYMVHVESVEMRPDCERTQNAYR